jgi:uncharacterized protein
MELLFIHSAGPQDDGEGSGPLLAALRHELAGEIAIHAPIMPAPDAPDAAAWGRALGEHVARLRPPFVLVGHSLGGSTILKWLAENPMPVRPAGVICIAMPYWTMPDWDVPEYAPPPGYADRMATLPMVIYHSRDDDVVPLSHLRRYGSDLPQAQLREVEGRGHLFAEGGAADIAADARRMLETAGATTKGR